MNGISFRDEDRFKRLAQKWGIVGHIVREEEEEERENKPFTKKKLTIDDLRAIFKKRRSE